MIPPLALAVAASLAVSVQDSTARIPGTKISLGMTVGQIEELNQFTEFRAAGAATRRGQGKFFGVPCTATLVFADGRLSRATFEAQQVSPHSVAYVEDQLIRAKMWRECQRLEPGDHVCDWLGDVRIHLETHTDAIHALVEWPIRPWETESGPVNAALPESATPPPGAALADSTLAHATMAAPESTAARPTSSAPSPTPAAVTPATLAPAAPPPPPGFNPFSPSATLTPTGAKPSPPTTPPTSEPGAATIAPKATVADTIVAKQAAETLATRPASKPAPTTTASKATVADTLLTKRATQTVATTPAPRPAPTTTASKATVVDTALAKQTGQTVATMPDTLRISLPELNPPSVWPRMLAVPPLEYPDAARRTGVQGVVWVMALVDTNGVVRSVRIDRGIPELNDAALAWATKARFAPCVRDQRPCRFWVRVAARFTPN